MILNHHLKRLTNEDCTKIFGTKIYWSQGFPRCQIAIEILLMIKRNIFPKSFLFPSKNLSTLLINKASRIPPAANNHNAGVKSINKSIHWNEKIEIIYNKTAWQYREENWKLVGIQKLKIQVVAVLYPCWTMKVEVDNFY